MNKVRNVLIGLLVFAVLAGVSFCGGGGGYGGGGTAMYSVGGNITGAAGTVTLRLNGGGDMPITGAGAQSFTFAGMIANGSTYNVQVVAPNQRCTVTNGAGTMGTANVTNVSITCGAQAAQMVIRSALLTGAAQNPPVATNASGVGGIAVDPSDPMNIKITGGITFSGLTPTAGGHHIHQAPSGNAGGNGAVIIGLTLASDGVTATVPPNTTLSQAQYDALLAGELYFNVHTAANVDGEIRGQINVQGGVYANVATLTGGQESPVVTTVATGTGTLLVDAATGTVLISYITHSVTNADMAHIHAALGPGTNGGVVVGFNQALGANIATAPAGASMAAQLGNLLIGYLYYNVHSTANMHPDGEIRGDITPIP